MAGGVAVAVLGAGDLVGEETLRLLAERDLPVTEVHAIDAGGAVGQPVEYGDTSLVVEGVEAFDFSHTRVVLSSSDPATAARYLPAALAAGCVVVDSSGYAESRSDAALVAADCNPQALERVQSGQAIATPGYAALQSLRGLDALQRSFGLTRAMLTVCHPAARGGRGAVESLARHSAAALNGQGVHAHGGTRPFDVVAAPPASSRGVPGVERHLRALLGDATLDLRVAELLAPVFYDCTIVLQADLADAADDAGVQDVLAAAGLQLHKPVHVHRVRGDGTSEDHGALRIQWLRVTERETQNVSQVSWCTSADAIRHGVAANHVEIAALVIRNVLAA